MTFGTTHINYGSMNKSPVVPLRMNDANLRRLIAKTASDSERVQVTRHARKRMQERKITLAQVLKVLQEGVVVEHAHQDIHGNWCCKLEKLVAGDRVGVVASLKEQNGTVVVVITVMTD